MEQIAEYLRTGHNAVAAASGPMAEEIQESSSGLLEPDLHAIAVYLKDLPGQDRTVRPVDASTPAMKAGEAIYVDECSACHARAGKGVAGLFPALAGVPVVQQGSAISLSRVVLQGARSAVTAGAPTGPAMPAYGWKLSDQQVGDLLTYVRNSWGNAADAVSASDVKGVRSQLSKQAAAD